RRRKHAASPNGTSQGTPRDPPPSDSAGTAGGPTVLPSPPMTERTSMDHTPGPRSHRPFPTAHEHPVGAPRHTAAPPEYEGRPLPHPEEDLEDQGLAFDVGTLVTRRGALGVLGAGSVAAVLAACSGQSASGSAASDGGGASDSGGASASTLEEMPGETAGPYPGDGSNGPDVLETSGVERSDIRSSIDSDTTAEGTG